MEELIRTKVDRFKIEDSVTLEMLENNIENVKIFSIEEVFENSKTINLNNSTLKMFFNGVLLKYELSDGVYKVYNNSDFMGLGTIKNNMLKRDVIVSDSCMDDNCSLEKN